MTNFFVCRLSLGNIMGNLPKLRSLASGWGKTATGGDVMSLLCAPVKNNTSTKDSFHSKPRVKC